MGVAGGERRHSGRRHTEGLDPEWAKQIKTQQETALTVLNQGLDRSTRVVHRPAHEGILRDIRDRTKRHSDRDFPTNGRTIGLPPWDQDCSSGRGTALRAGHDPAKRLHLGLVLLLERPIRRREDCGFIAFGTAIFSRQSCLIPG